jgi:hypothetical protein
MGEILNDFGLEFNGSAKQGVFSAMRSHLPPFSVPPLAAVGSTGFIESPPGAQPIHTLVPRARPIHERCTHIHSLAPTANREDSFCSALPEEASDGTSTLSHPALESRGTPRQQS